MFDLLFSILVVHSSLAALLHGGYGKIYALDLSEGMSLGIEARTT